MTMRSAGMALFLGALVGGGSVILKRLFSQDCSVSQMLEALDYSARNAAVLKQHCALSMHGHTLRQEQCKCGSRVSAEEVLIHRRRTLKDYRYLKEHVDQHLMAVAELQDLAMVISNAVADKDVLASYLKKAERCPQSSMAHYPNQPFKPSITYLYVQLDISMEQINAMQHLLAQCSE